MTMLSKPVHLGLLVVIAILFALTTVMAQTRDVEIINNTAMVLEELQIHTQQNEKEIVGRLAEPLSTGKSARVAIERGRCGYVLSGRYEDGSAVTARRNLCKHRSLRMIDLRKG
jgi:hypothetical protein